MDANDYQSQAMRTKAPQEPALNTLIHEHPSGIQVLHALVGIMGEVGELATQVEGWLWYGKPLDVVNLREELGDSEWYHAEFAEALHTKLGLIMERNIAKLRQRYPGKFNQHDAANRNLQAERGVLEEGSRTLETGPAATQLPNSHLPLSESYNRRCMGCGAPIHKANTAGLCTQCYVEAERQGKPLEEGPIYQHSRPKQEGGSSAQDV